MDSRISSFSVGFTETTPQEDREILFPTFTYKERIYYIITFLIT